VSKSLIFSGVFIVDRLIYAITLGFITFYFGAGEQSDIYFVAILIPTMAFNIFSEVTLVVINQALSKCTREVFWRAARQVLVFFGSILALLALIIFFSSDFIADLLAYKLNIEFKNTSSFYIKILAIQLVGNGFGAIVGSILIQRGQWIYGVIRSGIFSISTLVISLALYKIYFENVYAFVLGGVIASIITTLIGFYILIKNEDFSILKYRGMAQASSTGHLIWPLSLNIGVNISHNLILIIERIFASSYGLGAITEISLARSVVTLLGGIPNALGNANFVSNMEIPYGNRFENLRESIGNILNKILLVSIPFLIVFFISTNEIVEILFRRGKFSIEDAKAVSVFVMLFGAGIVHIVYNGTLQKIYQYLNLNLQLLMIVYIGVILYVATSNILAIDIGPNGLVASYSIALTLTVFIEYFYLKYRFGKIQVIKFPKRVIIISGLSIILGLLINQILFFTENPYIKVVSVAFWVFIFYVGAIYKYDSSFYKFLKHKFRKIS